MSTPKICLTTSVDGNSTGHECKTLEEAAIKAADWIRGIQLDDPESIGADFRISIELVAEA